jgi:hypothetical protein
LTLLGNTTTSIKWPSMRDSHSLLHRDRML